MTETRVEYAVRYDWRGKIEIRPSTEALAPIQAATANRSKLDVSATVVRRTITYGEWEPVSD